MDDSFPPVEQAVVAVRLLEGENAVSLARKTPGATDADVDELLNWAKRIELFDGRFDPTNLFFFPTPSGALAIGRLTPDRERPEDSGRYYFQAMLVARSVFYRCGANPATIYHLALNTTRFSLFTSKSRPTAFALDEARPWIDVWETRRTLEKVGVRAISTLTQSVLDAIQTSFASEGRAFLIVSTLFSLLPISWRPELTFSVGARFRGDAPIRLIGATVGRDGDVPYAQMTTPFFDLREVVENDEIFPIVNSWAATTETALKAGRFDFLYRKFAENFFRYRQFGDENSDLEPEISTDEIAAWGDAWGRELREELKSGATSDVGAEKMLDELEKWLKSEDFRESGDLDDENDSRDSSVWKDGEDDEDWGLDSERWRIDSTDADADRFDAAPERRGNVDFVFDDAPDDAQGDRTEESRDKNRKTFRRASKSLDDDLIRLLKKCRDANRDRAKRAAASDGLNGAERSPKNGRFDDGKTGETDRNGAEGSTQTPNGGRRVVVAGKLRGIDFAEAARRVQKALEPSKQKAADRDAFRLDDGLFDDRVESPFGSLRDEFPSDESTLRRLETLVDSALRGQENAARLLSDFWNSFRIGRDEETLWRIRDEYADYLRDALAAARDDDAIARIQLTTNALDVFDIIMR